MLQDAHEDGDVQRASLHVCVNNRKLWSEGIERKPALREMAKREEGGRKNECFPDRCINEMHPFAIRGPGFLAKKKKKKAEEEALPSPAD